MVTTRWPKDTPADVQALADELVAVLKGHDAEVVGPAIAITFAFVILSLAERADDMAAVDRMTADITELVTRYGAAIPRHTYGLN